MSVLSEQPVAAASDAEVSGQAPTYATEADMAQRRDELAQVMTAYNTVTRNLERSHEALRAQVARLEAQLARADEQLQRSRRLAALGEMAAGIAHEVRNPLAAIGLYAGILVEDTQSLAAGAMSGGASGGAGCTMVTVASNAAETARKIGAAVRGLDAIVGDVLDFARELRPQTRPVPVSDLLARALEAQGPALQAAGVCVRVSLPDQPPAVMVDADLIHQALVNLVRNAVQAMADESTRDLPRRLTVGAAEGDPVVITVRDTGPGIARQDRERIFNPFFTTRNTGTGLGLAIVHRIADAHGGGIAVHNDGGAVFELRLPAAVSVAASAPSVSRSQA
jgi:signal transduction histidine kinase